MILNSEEYTLRNSQWFWGNVESMHNVKSQVIFITFQTLQLVSRLIELTNVTHRLMLSLWMKGDVGIPSIASSSF